MFRINNKIILLSGVLLILLIAAAYWFYQNNKSGQWICKNGEWIRQGSPKTSQPKEECKGKRLTTKVPSVPPESTILSFYNWAEKQNEILENSQYKESKLLSDDFKQQIEKTLKAENYNGINPLFCSNDKFKNITIINRTLNNNQASVSAELEFETQKTRVLITLKAVGDNWIIFSIECR